MKGDSSSSGIGSVPNFLAQQHNPNISLLYNLRPGNGETPESGGFFKEHYAEATDNLDSYDRSRTSFNEGGDFTKRESAFF